MMPFEQLQSQSRISRENTLREYDRLRLAQLARLGARQQGGSGKTQRRDARVRRALWTTMSALLRPVRSNP